MKTFLPTLLILGAAFVGGLGVGLARKDHFNAQQPSSAATEPPTTTRSQAAAESVSYWRQRFLAILDEPSSSRRMASFYALALEAEPVAMPTLMEAIYPEGWARHYGDLPLAIAMEWVSHDPSGMAGWCHAFAARRPELIDNLEAIIGNLGFQGNLAAVPALAALPSGSLRQQFVAAFLADLGEYHPDRLFAARYALLPARIVFNQLREAEIEPAAEAFWADSARLLQEGVNPTHAVWFTLGKCHGKAFLERYPDHTGQPAFISGLALDTSLDSQLLLALALDYWQPIDPGPLSSEDAQAILLRLFPEPALRDRLRLAHGFRFLERAVDARFAQTLLSRYGHDRPFAAFVLSHSAHLLDQETVRAHVAALPAFAREHILAKPPPFASEAEAIAWLDAMPSEWITSGVVASYLESLPGHAGAAAFAALAQKVGQEDLARFTINNRFAAQRLFAISPETFFANIAQLPAGEQANHLSWVAELSEEDDIPLLIGHLPAGARDSLLVELTNQNPAFAFTELARNGLDSLGAGAARELGVMLNLEQEIPEACSLLQSLTLQSIPEQLAYIAYLQSIEEDEENPVPVTPQRDYLDRFAAIQASFGDRGDIEPLVALRNEAPDTFIALFKRQDRWDHDWRDAAQQLLQSPALTEAEKLELHASLFDESE